MWKEPHTHAQHDRCSAAVMCWDVGHPALSCVVFTYIFVVYAHFFSCRPFSLHFLHFHCMCTTPQTPTFVSGAFSTLGSSRGGGRGPCMHSKIPISNASWWHRTFDSKYTTNACLSAFPLTDTHASLYKRQACGRACLYNLTDAVQLLCDGV